MKKLVDLVEIKENNEMCVVLKVKENSKIDLISLGSLDGNEEFIRYTKGKDHIITIFTEKGETYSWDFGQSGHTLISKKTKMQQELIVKCIEQELDIYCGGNRELIEKNLKDFNKSTIKHKVSISHDKERTGINIAVYKDGEFYAWFPTYKDALNHFRDMRYKIEKTGSHIDKDGFPLDKFDMIRKNPFYKKYCKKNISVDEKIEEFE